jgi:hypothetical protein
MMETVDALAEREEWLADRLAWLRDGGARTADGRPVVLLTGAAKAMKLATETAKRAAAVYEAEQRRKEEAWRESKALEALEGRGPTLRPQSALRSTT